MVIQSFTGSLTEASSKRTLIILTNYRIIKTLLLLSSHKKNLNILIDLISPYKIDYHHTTLINFFAFNIYSFTSVWLKHL